MSLGDFIPFLPEIVLAIGGFVVLLLGARGGGQPRQLLRCCPSARSRSRRSSSGGWDVRPVSPS